MVSAHGKACAVETLQRPAKEESDDQEYWERLEMERAAEREEEEQIQKLPVLLIIRLLLRRPLQRLHRTRLPMRRHHPVRHMTLRHMFAHTHISFMCVPRHLQCFLKL
jgi:hypothetical protein